MALGRMVWERGDLAGGSAHARRAQAMLEPLVAGAASAPSQRIQLHAAYDLLGQMALEAGEIGQALDFHRADLKQLDLIAPADRQRPDVRRAISITYGHLADAQVEWGDLAGALESHRQSLQLREALVAEFPDNAEYERNAGSARYYMASVLTRLGRWQEALEIFQTILAADPNGSFSQFRVGEALVHLGRHREALPHLRRALSLNTAAFRADSGNLFHRLAIAGDQAVICRAMAALDRPDAAAACAGTAAYLSSTPLEASHAFPRAYFGGILYDLGEAYDTLAARSAPPERRALRVTARKMYGESFEIWRDLTARGLVSPVDTFRLGAAARAVARTDSALGPADRSVKVGAGR